MMDDVEIPEEPRFMAYAMKPVVGEIVDEKEKRPGPPCFGREFIWRQFVKEQVNKASNEAEDRTPEDTAKTKNDVGPGVTPLILIYLPARSEPRLKSDKKRKERYGNYSWF